MKKILILLLLFPFLLPVAMGQNQKVIDSLLKELKLFAERKEQLGTKAGKMYDTAKVKILDQLSRKYWGNNSDAALDYANQTLALATEIGYKKGIAFAYNSFGSVCDDKGDYIMALENYKTSLKIRTEIGDKEGEAYSYNNLGIIYKKQGNYPEALQNYLTSLKIWEEMGNKKGMSMAYNNIGIIHMRQGNYDEALKFYQKSLNAQDPNKKTEAAATALKNMGTIYKLQGKLDDALKIDLECISFFEEIGNKRDMAATYENIGLIYIEQKKFEEALKNYQRALSIREDIGDKQGIATSYNNIGEFYLKQGKLPLALNNQLKGLAVAKTIGHLDLIKAIYASISEIDSAMNNYKEAFQYRGLFHQVKDSLFNAENQKKIAQLQMQYVFDRKQDSLKAEQAKADAVSKEAIKRETTLKNTFIIGFLLVLLLLGVIYNRYRLKINANNLLKEKNDIISEEKGKVEYEKKRSELLLLNILPSEVAAELKETGTATARNFDLVTVMFTDFKDFTKIGEQLSAEQLVESIHYCFSQFDKILQKHGVEKIKTIGDAYMCAGGLPVKNATNPIDVVRAGLEIRDFVEKYKAIKIAKGETPFEMRIGIHTGPVVAGIVGEMKFAYDIWGDTVNLAARMEASGEVGRVNVSSATYELIKDKFKCTYRGKIEAKNKGYIDMYFVEDL